MPPAGLQRVMGAPAVAGAATAAPQQTAVDSQIPIATIPCFPNTSSSFTVDVFQVANTQKLTMSAGGDVVSTTGKLVLSFTNETTSKTIVRNVSGPTTVTTNSDGTSGVFQGTGNNWLGFGPGGQANTGEPGLVFTSGPVTVTFAPNAAGVPTVQTFSLNGHQDNGCALLS